MGKVIFIVLAIFLLLGVFSSPILDGIKGWRTEDTTQSFAVSTGAGQTTANVTLSSDLFQDDVSEVVSISSNISESPAATNYTASTKVLLVSALTASQNRTLSINYYADSESTIMQAVGPFLGVLIIGGLIFGIFISMRRR